MHSTSGPRDARERGACLSRWHKETGCLWSTPNPKQRAAAARSAPSRRPHAVGLVRRATRATSAWSPPAPRRPRLIIALAIDERHNCQHSCLRASPAPLVGPLMARLAQSTGQPQQGCLPRIMHIAEAPLRRSCGTGVCQTGHDDRAPRAVTHMWTGGTKAADYGEPGTPVGPSLAASHGPGPGAEAASASGPARLAARPPRPAQAPGGPGRVVRDPARWPGCLQGPGQARPRGCVGQGWHAAAAGAPHGWGGTV